ncbi:MAG: aldo/keto reductase [Verrucomicrobia bacterium]|nr:aldo/keto reductase [Prolixibacteraceae bacterium]
MSPKALGNTGLTIPPIIYGTSFMGNLYQELPWEMKLQIMKQWFAVSASPPMIDTAGKYGAGLALEVIGKGLKELGIKNDELIISNKLGWYRVPLTTKEPTFEPGAWVNLEHDAVQKISYSGILECWHQGCELLGGYYKPQVVTVHDPDEYLFAATDEADRAKRFNDILEAYRALFELKEKGEVKAVGIGAKDWLTIKELYTFVKFDWVMFANKLTIYHHPPEILAFVERLALDGVGIINSAIFNAGFLTGGDYFDYRKINPTSAEDQKLLAWREAFFAICLKYGVDPGDACLHFARAMPQISAVALNPSKPERIRRNVEVLSAKLPLGFWKEMKEQKLIGAHFNYLSDEKD